MPRLVHTTATLLALCLWAAQPMPARAEPAPDFKVTDLDGVSHSLANYRGRVLLLNFWATWCNDCKREVPSLVRLDGEARPGLAILGLAVNDAEPNVRAFIGQQKITYPIALDDDSVVTQLHEIEFIPTIVIIDRDGELHDTIVGFGTVAHFEASVLRSLFEVLPRAVEPRGKAAVTWAAMKSR